LNGRAFLKKEVLLPAHYFSFFRFLSKKEIFFKPSKTNPAANIQRPGGFRKFKRRILKRKFWNSKE